MQSPPFSAGVSFKTLTRTQKLIQFRKIQDAFKRFAETKGQCTYTLVMLNEIFIAKNDSTDAIQFSLVGDNVTCEYNRVKVRKEGSHEEIVPLFEEWLASQDKLNITIVADHGVAPLPGVVPMDLQQNAVPDLQQNASPGLGNAELSRMLKEECALAVKVAVEAVEKAAQERFDKQEESSKQSIDALTKVASDAVAFANTATQQANKTAVDAQAKLDALAKVASDAVSVASTAAEQAKEAKQSAQAAFRQQAVTENRLSREVLAVQHANEPVQRTIKELQSQLEKMKLEQGMKPSTGEGAPKLDKIEEEGVKAQPKKISRPRRDFPEEEAKVSGTRVGKRSAEDDDDGYSPREDVVSRRVRPRQEPPTSLFTAINRAAFSIVQTAVEGVFGKPDLGIPKPKEG
jgi:hypothetical protein